MYYVEWPSLGFHSPVAIPLTTLTQIQFKFRSKIQVQKFLECVQKVGGDERLAIREYKNVA